MQSFRFGWSKDSKGEFYCRGPKDFGEKGSLGMTGLGFRA